MRSVRLFKGQIKYLLREVVPLSHFAVWRWPKDDVLITPNAQSCGGPDAVVKQVTTGESTEVEICWPSDGEQRNQDAIAVNENRPPEYCVRDIDEAHHKFLDRFRHIARRKATKDYTGGILLFVLDLGDFSLNEPSHKKCIMEFVEELKTIPFRADEVYLLLHPTSCSKTYFESPIMTIGSVCPATTREQELRL